MRKIDLRYISGNDKLCGRPHPCEKHFQLHFGCILCLVQNNKGIIWPEAVAPYQVHLISIKKDAEEIYDSLRKSGIEVLYDDRDASAGEKFADSDLIGIPYRAVVSERTGDKIEIKKRNEKEAKLIDLKTLQKTLKAE